MPEATIPQLPAKSALVPDVVLEFIAWQASPSPTQYANSRCHRSSRRSDQDGLAPRVQGDIILAGIGDVQICLASAIETEAW
jgi:hypothetical protein